MNTLINIKLDTTPTNYLAIHFLSNRVERIMYIRGKFLKGLHTSISRVYNHSTFYYIGGDYIC